MGTSSPFLGPGNGTPLLPDWADDDDPSPNPEPDDDLPIQDGEPAQPDNAPDEPAVEPSDTLEQRPEDGLVRPSDVVQEPLRFSGSRANFTRFVRSNGTDRAALSRAIGTYVKKGAGGSGTAARRMGNSSAAASRFVNFLRDVRVRGVEEVLRSLSLDSLVGKSPKEILLAFTDVICSPGGPIDESIAREAYVETVIAATDLGENLAAISEDQISSITTEFITRSIVTKIFIDIGQAIDVQTLTGENANYLAQLTYEFVGGLVRDRIQPEVQKTRNLRTAAVRSAMKKIYEIGFRQMQIELDAI